MDLGILVIGVLMSAGTVVLGAYLVARAVHDSRESTARGRGGAGGDGRGSWNGWVDQEVKGWTPNANAWTPDEETAWEPGDANGWSPDETDTGGGIPLG